MSASDCLTKNFLLKILLAECGRRDGRAEGGSTAELSKKFDVDLNRATTTKWNAGNDCIYFHDLYFNITFNACHMKNFNMQRLSVVPSYWYLNTNVLQMQMKD